MTWQDEFIKVCLKKVPAGAYRIRTEAELREHMEILIQERRAAGAGEEQLRREVLARMGDPARLQKAYQAEGLRRKALEPRYTAECWLTSVVWMELCWFVLYLLLAAVGFGNDSGAFPLYAHPGRTLFVGAVSAVLPTLVSGWYLSGALRFHIHPKRMVCAGLGLIWLVICLEQLGLGALAYGIPLWRLGELFARLSGGSDPTFPWFTLCMRDCCWCGACWWESGCPRYAVPWMHGAQGKRLGGIKSFSEIFYYVQRFSVLYLPPRLDLVPFCMPERRACNGLCISNFTL